jgi:hypothetical protein
VREAPRLGRRVGSAPAQSIRHPVGHAWVARPACRGELVVRIRGLGRWTKGAGGGRVTDYTIAVLHYGRRGGNLLCHSAVPPRRDSGTQACASPLPVCCSQHRAVNTSAVAVPGYCLDIFRYFGLLAYNFIGVYIPTYIGIHIDIPIYIYRYCGLIARAHNYSNHLLASLLSLCNHGGTQVASRCKTPASLQRRAKQLLSASYRLLVLVVAPRSRVYTRTREGERAAAAGGLGIRWGEERKRVLRERASRASVYTRCAHDSKRTGLRTRIAW